MAAANDLWGELGIERIPTPVAILKDQAAFLGDRTQNILRGHVNSWTQGDGTFVHSFDIVVPALENYAYHLFSIRHGVDSYPVTVDDNGDGTVLVTEDQFKDWLRNKLASPETKKILNSLYSQATK